MDLRGKKIGFCITGSFCTLSKIPPVVKALCEAGAEVVPIMSDSVMSTDTRFGRAEDFVAEIESICGRKVIGSIVTAEPIGPKNILDVVVVAPCTGNTIAKLAYGIVDNTVTMACKASLRNGNPLVLAISTNDALAANAKNIGALLNTKNVYFVPFRQDDCVNKATSAVADMGLIARTLEEALDGKQLQPVIIN